MLSPGQRPHRVRFETRTRVNPDAPADLGTVEDRWLPACIVWAGFRPKFGSEQLRAGALESELIGVITVLRSSRTAEITAAARLVFVSGPYRGLACAIRSVVPSPDATEIEFLVDTGAT